MAVVDENRYKSNSYRSKAEAEKREVQKVVKGSTSVHRKTTWEKIKDAYFGPDVENLGEHIVFNLLIPWSKDLVDILVTNTKDMVLYGEVRDTPPSRGRTGRNGGSYIPYDGYSRRSRRDTEAARRARFDFTYIEFDSLDDIDDVIDEMRDLWNVYDVITVEQFYLSAAPEGLKISPIDSNWGWNDIRAFTMADRRKIRKRNPKTDEIEIKWVLDLPRPKPID